MRSVYLRRKSDWKLCKTMYCTLSYFLAYSNVTHTCNFSRCFGVKCHMHIKKLKLMGSMKKRRSTPLWEGDWAFISKDVYPVSKTFWVNSNHLTLFTYLINWQYHVHWRIQPCCFRDLHIFDGCITTLCLANIFWITWLVVSSSFWMWSSINLQYSCPSFCSLLDENLSIKRLIQVHK